MRTLLVLSAVLLCAACGGPASTQSELSHQADTCRPAELRALFRGFQAAGASLTAAVVFVDTGSGSCWLDGSPRSVSLLDGDGSAVSVRSRPVGVPIDGGPVELLPDVSLPSFGDPPAAGSAWFVVTWSNWCTDPPPAVSSLLVVLPAGGTVSAQLDTGVPGWAAGPPAPRCDSSRAGSNLTAGRFQPPPR